MSESKDSVPCLGFHGVTRASQDPCYITKHTKSSIQAGQYPLGEPPLHTPDLYQDRSLCQPNVNFGGAKTSGSQGIDQESHLRNVPLQTFSRCTQELMYYGSPYRLHGSCHADTETELIHGHVHVQKDASQDSLLEHDFSHFKFTPSPDESRKFQDETQCVEQTVDAQWVRGGLDTRDLTRNPASLKSQGYHYNGRYWENPRNC